MNPHLFILLTALTGTVALLVMLVSLVRPRKRKAKPTGTRKAQE